MAKTMWAASSDGAGCSHSAGSSSSTQFKPSSTRSRPRRRSVWPPKSPSSALLAALGTIAAPFSLVEGTPAPLPFLYPYNRREENDLDAPQPSAFPPSDDVNTPTSEPIPSTSARPHHRHLIRLIPDRYEQGDDGRWRKVVEYTLYGSTVCATCNATSPPVSTVDDQIQVTPSLSTPTQSLTPGSNILDTLPTGWKPIDRSLRSRTTLILAFSLVLAFFICFFIIGCLFWRKNKRKKYRENDIEMRARKRQRSEDVDHSREILVEREMKVKQKLWARATARWKANARYSARQRRGKRSSIYASRGSQAQNSSASLDLAADDRQHPTPSPSRSPSPASSRRSSLSIHGTEIPTMGATPDNDELCEAEGSGSSPTAYVSPPTPVPASPPAYHHRSLSGSHGALDAIANGDRRNRLTPSTRSPYQSRRPSHSSMRSSSRSEVDSDLFRPPIHAGHVATDDKALLARLADLVSSPPGQTGGEPSHIAAASVPVWQDEEFEDFDGSTVDLPQGRGRDHDDSSRSRTHSPTPPFPPPPSQEKSSAFYEYGYSSYGDLPLFEPEPEPSAPPFEEAASIPHGHFDVSASAPPLTDFIEAFEHDDAHADAELSSASEGRNDGEQKPGQNHDRDVNDETASVRSELPRLASVSSLNLAMELPVSVPPGYS